MEKFDQTPNAQEIIDRLKAEGYDNVYEYTAKAGEVDEEHDHPHDTHLVVLSGMIEIQSEGMRYLMVAGEEADIPRKTPHSAHVMAKGCTYIVAEKY